MEEGIRAKQWDLDEIIASDKWQLITPEIDEEDLDAFTKFIGDDTGTMVVWGKIDRLIKSKSK